MSVAKRRQQSWTAEDQSMYAKWRKAVAVLYGALGLIFLLGTSAYHLAGGWQQEPTALLVASAKTIP
jgi:hypothetical protein